MAALHEALKSLSPADFADVSLEDSALRPFLTSTFSSALTVCESIPIAGGSEAPSPTDGSPTSSTSSPHSAADISPSSVRSPEPPPEISVLQKEWKSVKVNAKENPLEIRVYKAGAKDGNGAWFARRSVHEGLSFAKWKRALETEFIQAIPKKSGGDPGAGNIRGIGGERLVEVKDVEGVGKLEVYLLSAQFPGPTAPRDWVTLFLTSDAVLPQDPDAPRHFMIVSKPCEHPDTQPRQGLIRGSYESIEFIREIRPHAKPLRAASAIDLPATQGRQELSGTDLPQDASKSQDWTTPSIGDTSQPLPKGGQRARGKTISIDGKVEPPVESSDDIVYPVEWIMVTRSNPGGNIPRFMIERGTPGSIVADASKFLDYACSTELQDFGKEPAAADVDHHATPQHDRTKAAPTEKVVGNKHAAHNHTNTAKSSSTGSPPHNSDSTTGIYNMVVGAATAAGSVIAAHTPAVIIDNLPHFDTVDAEDTGSSQRRDSLSTIASGSSGSFASALDRRDSANIRNEVNDGEQSTKITASSDSKESRKLSQHEKELAKLEERKRKLEAKFQKERERELHKKDEDQEREASSTRKATERHEKEIKKQEERHKRELEKLERKKEKEAEKVEQRRRKAMEKDEKMRLQRELDETKARLDVVEREKELLKKQVGDLQAENTALTARLGHLGKDGAEVLKDFKEGLNSSSSSMVASLNEHDHGSPARSSHDRRRTGSLSAMMRSPKAASVMSDRTGRSSDTTML